MTPVVYVPRDSSAVSMGAEEVADAIAHEAQRRSQEIRLIRNGSRGLYWLEPMVEVETRARPGCLWAGRSPKISNHCLRQISSTVERIDWHLGRLRRSLI